MTSARGRLAPRTTLVFVLCLVLLICEELFARAHGIWFPSVLWFVVGLAIGVACHELGHVLCARIGSIQVRRIVIGLGPLLWRSRFGETWLELRFLPLSGLVSTYPAVNSPWYWWALFLCGGVLGNVAVICVVAWLVTASVAPEQAG